MSKTTFSMPVIFVADIATSKKFYQDIFKFEIETDFGLNISFKDSIALWQIERAEEIIYGSIEENRFETGVKATELYFQTEDIETLQKALKAKKTRLIHDLKEETWGQRTIRFYDPDKFIIEVAEPMESVILRLYQSGMATKEVSQKSQIPLAAVEKIIAEK